MESAPHNPGSDRTGKTGIPAGVSHVPGLAGEAGVSGEPASRRRDAFAPTHWTLVLRARGHSPEAQVALGALCEAYWQPVFRFLRREGRDEDSARELAQEFFARLLQGGRLDSADPARGRFRSFLLGAVKHFLADMREHEQRQKRGGGLNPESLEAAGGNDTATELQVEDRAARPSDECFDREWALTVMDRALAALQKEVAASGKGEQFEVLKPWLMGDAGAGSQADAGIRLGLSEGAVKVAVHRLRKRFRELVKSDVAQTLGDPALVPEELRYLVEVLSRG
jgi:RNA polymerase sigma factor (sigma-70 family)